MSRGPAVAVVLALVLLAWGAMYLGWRGRVRRQADVPAPAVAAGPLVQRAATEGVEVTYVSTTSATDWLDRIAVHGLGTRSDARVLATAEGVVVARAGAADLFVPRGDLRAVHRDRFRAGKAMTGEGLLVWDWTLGDRLVATAVKPRHDADRDALQTLIQDLIDRHPHHQPQEAM